MVGDTVEVWARDGQCWALGFVDHATAGTFQVSTGGRHYRPDEAGRLWRWPSTAQGGGSLPAPSCPYCFQDATSRLGTAEPALWSCGHCNGAWSADGSAVGGGSAALGYCGPLMWSRGGACCPDCDHNKGEVHRCAGCGMEGSGSAELPAPTRCPVRVSDPGEAIENCGTIIGREVSCFVCSGKRCYVHCGCLSHVRGAKVVSRGGNGTFEWCVWALEHAFRGQLYAPAADRSGLAILGTHGGASAGEVLSILMRSIGRIQGGTDTKREAAADLSDVDALDPGAELERVDALVAQLLDRVKRGVTGELGELQKRRVWILRVCQDWLRATEHSWRDLADDPEQNPRLVWQAKELHDQQVADLFYQLGQIVRGGAL